MRISELLRFYIHLAGCCFLLSVLVPGASDAQTELYFPNNSEKWESVKPAKLGWDTAKLDKAVEYAGQQKSSGMVILQNGKIISEKYWDVNTLILRSMTYGKDARGQNLEDVASIQKSVAATLFCIAIQKKIVQSDDQVSKHLGEGWSRAPVDKESAITLEHIATMTTGLSDQLEFVDPPGAKWRYNSHAYSRIMGVLESATKMDRNELTKKWITDPIGMNESKWVVRRRAKEDPKTNRHGFVTSARELSRFGLLVLAKGKWDGKTVFEDDEYFQAMLKPSQKLNPAYGYLWWLNGQSHVLRPGRNQLVAGPLNKHAPDDMVAGLGALGRKVYIVPSMNLVVTRLGSNPERNFDNEIWRLLMAAKKR